MIVNSSNRTYAATFTNVNYPANFEAEFGGEITSEAVSLRIFAPANFEAAFSGLIRTRTRTQTSLNFLARFRGNIAGRLKLALTTPDPIINEISATAFQKQYYAAKLTDNLGNEIDFTSATIEAPKGNVGKKISINVAKKDLSLITKDKKYTFQIGTRDTPTGAISWQTILAGAELLSRSFSLGWGNNAPADSLSFGATAVLPVNLYPRENHIFYDRRKTTVEITDEEKIYDNLGTAVKTTATAFNFLTLYTVFDHIRKFAGFAAIETNIPNFEIVRADFPITRTWMQSLSGLIGMFEPVIFSTGSTLWIIDKTATLPPEFSPRAVTANEFSNWSCSLPEEELIEGLLLSYADSRTQADYYTDRYVYSQETTGTFGTSDYTVTDIERKYRDWRRTGENEILKTELVSEKHTVHDSSFQIIGEETTTNVYDAQGKRKSSVREISARVPNLNGSVVLQTVRRETLAVSYKTDPRNPRRQIQSGSYTTIQALVAVDEENAYFDEPFRQDFLEAHKAGNLADGMTSEFALVKTVSEQLTSLGNGQFGVRVCEIDHLRNATTNSLSEVRTGDASLAATGGKLKRILILKSGLTQATRRGLATPEFNVGELPLVFAKPLAERNLSRRLAGYQEGNISVIGFDSSIERGVMFRVLDREGNSYGKFIAEGYRVEISALGDGVRIQTDLEVSEL